MPGTSQVAQRYLFDCLEELLDALCDVHQLIQDGLIDHQVEQRIRYAQDLLDIVEQGVRASSPDGANTMQHVREKVSVVSKLMPTSRTVH